MKRLSLTLFIIVTSILSVHSQDLLITKTGDVIKGYNLDIGGSAIYYKPSKGDNTIKSIEKDKVLMIKREDGSIENFYDQGNNSPSPTASDMSAKTSRNEGTFNANVLSEKEKIDNEEFIAKLNSENPEYALDDKDKKANRVLCLLGLKKGSVFTNEDVEMRTWYGAWHDTNYSFTNPSVRFKVLNKSNRTIYIDLGNTFIIRNGVAQAYYIPQSTSNGVSTGNGGSVNLGAVAGALGIGGKLGILAGGINMGKSSENSSVTTTYSQRKIAVPPKSVKVLEPMSLFTNTGMCGSGMKVVNTEGPMGGLWPIFNIKSPRGEFKRGEILNIDEEETPFSFSGFVSYSFTEDCSEEKSISFTVFLRKVIGFNTSNFSGKYSCKKIEDSFKNYSGCTFFVGYVESTPKEIEKDGLTDSYLKVKEK